MLQCSVSHVIRSEAALFSNQAFVGVFDVVSRRPALRAVLRAARLGPRAGSPATRLPHWDRPPQCSPAPSSCAGFRGQGPDPRDRSVRLY